MSTTLRQVGGSASDSADARVQRYRQVERALWNHYGLEPSERFIELESPPARLRVVEVGSGEPVLLVPGTAGTGPYWAPLVRELRGCRCLMLDRPGWGLSSPIEYSRDEYKSVVADVMTGVIDALGLDRANVVGASIGEIWALRLAARHPDRVVHGWDLAIATGQKLHIDDDIAQALYEMTSGMMAPIGSYLRMTSFKDPVSIDDGAPPPERLLAYLGRDPRT